MNMLNSEECLFDIECFWVNVGVESCFHDNLVQSGSKLRGVKLRGWGINVGISGAFLEYRNSFSKCPVTDCGGHLDPTKANVHVHTVSPFWVSGLKQVQWLVGLTGFLCTAHDIMNRATFPKEMIVIQREQVKMSRLFESAGCHHWPWQIQL